MPEQTPTSIPIQGGSAGKIGQESIFESLLYGVRGCLRQKLGLQNINYVFNNNIKGFLKNQQQVTYPRGLIRITGTENMMEINNRAMAHRGVVAYDAQTKQTVKLANVFPIKLTCEFHYCEQDRLKSIIAMQNIATVIGAKAFGFAVEVEGLFQYKTEIQMDPQISVPDQDLTDPADPGIIDLMFTFGVRGYVGRVDEYVRPTILSKPAGARTALGFEDIKDIGELDNYAPTPDDPL